MQHNNPIQKQRPIFMDEAFALLKKHTEPDQALEAFISLRSHKQYKSHKIDIEIGIARCYQGKKMYKEAEVILLSLNPPSDFLRDRQNLQLALHFLYMEQGKTDLARTALEKSPNQRYPKLYLAWISYYLKINDVESATNKLQELEKLRIDLRYKKDFEAGKFDKDIRKFTIILYNDYDVDEIYQIAKEDYPHFVRLKNLHKLILMIKELEGKERGEKNAYLMIAIKEIINFAPKLNYAYIILADLYESQGKIGKAITELTRLAERSPEDWDCHMKLGLYLHKNYQQDEARVALLKVLNAYNNPRCKTKPRPVVVAKAGNCLALTYIDYPKEHDKVLKYAQEAINAAPEYAPTYSTLGKYWRLHKKEERAQEFFNKAMELDRERWERLHRIKKPNITRVTTQGQSQGNLSQQHDTVTKEKPRPAKPLQKVNAKQESDSLKNPFNLLSEIDETETIVATKELPVVNQKKDKIRSRKEIIENETTVPSPENSIEEPHPTAQIESYILPGHIGGALKSLIRWGYSYFQTTEEQQQAKSEEIIGVLNKNI